MKNVLSGRMNKCTKGRPDQCDGATWDEDAFDGESIFEFVPVWYTHT